MNRVVSSFPNSAPLNITFRLWLMILSLFLSPTVTSTKIVRKTGRHRYTVLHVYDTDDGPCSESFHVLAYTEQEAAERRRTGGARHPMNGIEPFETHVFRGWNVHLYMG